MPHAPKRHQDEAPDQRPVQPLQTRQRETTPPDLFEDRPSGKEENGSGHHVKKQGRRHSRCLKRSKCPRHDDRAEHDDCGDADEGEQVPSEPYSPQHDPSQQAPHAFSTPGHDRHDERRQGRSHYQGDGVYIVRYALTIIWQEAYAVFGKVPRAPRQPCERVGQGKEGNQWMADHQAPKRRCGRRLRCGGCGGHDRSPFECAPE